MTFLQTISILGAMTMLSSGSSYAMCRLHEAETERRRQPALGEAERLEFAVVGEIRLRGPAHCQPTHVQPFGG